jgi:hypothetical protein
MKRIPMIAAKSLTYGTRRLRAGDTFDASRQDVRVLTAVGLARETNRPPPPPNTQSAKGDAPRREPDLRSMEDANTDIDMLRQQYQAIKGREPDKRWRVARLRAEIESEA